MCKVAADCLTQNSIKMAESCSAVDCNNRLSKKLRFQFQKNKWKEKTKENQKDFWKSLLHVNPGAEIKDLLGVLFGCLGRTHRTGIF